MYCHSPILFPFFFILEVCSYLFRSKPVQSKTKKESKLDLFGFDDGDAPAAEGDPASAGNSNYKIKYFGFDDLSESDGDGDEIEDKPKKTKRMASVRAEVSGAACVEFSRPKAPQENSSTGQNPSLGRGLYTHVE